MMPTGRLRIVLALSGVLASAPIGAQPGAPAPPESHDDDLGTALAHLFDPFVLPTERVTAFSSPSLREPRAIPPLVFLLSDRSAEVRASAARALGAFAGDPRVETVLVERLRNRSEVDAVRVACAEALSQTGGAAAGDALYDRFVDLGETPSVRTAAQHALETRFPDLLRTRPGPQAFVRVDRSGRNLLVLGGTALGSFALASVGALGQNTAGTTIGALGGAVTGAGVAYFLTRTGEITDAQAGWITSAGVWGAGLGMLAAGATQDGPSNRYVLSLGLAGETLGVAGSLATAGNLSYTASDIALIDLGGALGFDLAYAGYLLQDSTSDRLLTGSLFAGGAGGLAVTAVLAPRIHLSSVGDRALVAEGAFEGLTYGLLVPPAVRSTNSRRDTAGAFLGGGLGVVAGTALAQFTDVDADKVGLVWLIGAYGKLLGVSLPLLGDGDDAALARGTMIGSTIALAGGALVAPGLSFHDGDVALVTVGTGLGLWHGVAFAESSKTLDSSQKSALPLLATSVAGLGSIALAQKLDLGNTDVLALGGGAFWGNWFTLWTQVLAAGPNDKLDLRPAALVGDVGLAAGAALATQVDPRRIGIAYLGGLSGAGLGSLGAALATKDNNAVITANLIGSAVGLLGGAVLASSVHLSSPTSTAVSRVPGLGTPTFGPLVVAAPTAPAVGLSVTFVQ